MAAPGVAADHTQPSPQLMSLDIMCEVRFLSYHDSLMNHPITMNPSVNIYTL